ncbi:pyrimidine dimer DNA glycosylase/endonuclease V [Candidatus Woesearchaeota archaeon]|nr:pyrimidine dimer DNA glycosylase/endonuclease V [Candidatus Woesearchaeota archaeon]
MRLWSIHPKYLDHKGLVALWREALLAQKVLQGKTKGYTQHPQLARFRRCKDPEAAIGKYLEGVYNEACARDYNFDSSKIAKKGRCLLKVTRGQLEYEFSHLSKKLQQRDIKRYEELKGHRHVEPHPIFRAVPGDVEPWEKV